MKDVSGWTRQTVVNEAFQAKGGQCSRVLLLPRKTGYQARRYQAQFQLDRSAAQLQTAEVTVALPFAAWPGDLVDLAGWGGGSWRVRESKVTLGEGAVRPPGRPTPRQCSERRQAYVDGKDPQARSPGRAGAELGQVTLAGPPVGVALAGGPRNVTVCLPGGYHWTPQRGQAVHVVKSGTGGISLPGGRPGGRRDGPR